MKWGQAIGITFIFICIILFEWPKLKKKQKKEKGVFITLSVIGWLLGNILLFFPDTPGPTDLVDMIFKPLGKLLE